MCGRYRLKDPKRAFDFMEVVAQSSDFLPRFNIAPSQRVAVVPRRGVLEEMTWGIVPLWAGETSSLLINARSESVREKRSFKAAFRERRCLMPADGFYEWSKFGKRPYLFTIQGGPFAIAALWEPGDSSRVCLLTTAGNALLAPIHNRMPVIVRREDWDEWLAPDELSAAGFSRITAPYAEEEMQALEVSRTVNNARIDDARCNESAAQVNGRPEPTAYDPEQESDGLTYDELRKLSASAPETIGMTPDQRDQIVGDAREDDVNSHDG